MTNRERPQADKPDRDPDYAQDGQQPGGKIRAWWNRGSGAQKTLIILGVVAFVIAVLVSVLGGGEDEKPASMESYSPPAVDGGSTAPDDQRETPQRDSRPSAQPRTEEDTPASEPAGAPQDNSNDARVTRATYVLDDVVNDPEMALAGFDAISQRLQEESALTPDGTVRDTYQMLEYLAGSNAFASRASQPHIVDKGDGIYSVEYDVSGAVAPTKRGDSGASLRKDIGNQMEQALFAGISVPVTFTVDLNAGTVSTDTSRWW